MSSLLRKGSLPSRDRRVNSLLWGTINTAVTTGIMALGGTFIDLSTGGQQHDFWVGFISGALGVSPFGAALFLYVAYRQMDEYGQRQQEQACSLAFIVMILAASAGALINSWNGKIIPLWAAVAVGALTYAAALIRGNLAARGADE